MSYSFSGVFGHCLGLHRETSGDLNPVRPRLRLVIWGGAGEALTISKHNTLFAVGHEVGLFTPSLLGHWLGAPY